MSKLRYSALLPCDKNFKPACDEQMISLIFNEDNLPLVSAEKITYDNYYLVPECGQTEHLSSGKEEGSGRNEVCFDGRLGLQEVDGIGVSTYNLVNIDIFIS